MSRTKARDVARRQLAETVKVLNDCVLLLSRSSALISHLDTPEVAQYLADLDAFWKRPFPQQAAQHLDNRAVDTFAAAMKAKLANARAKGRQGWSEAAARGEQLADLRVGHLSRSNFDNFEAIVNFAMMLHLRGTNPTVQTSAFHRVNKPSQPIAWDVLSSRGSWCKTVRGHETALAAKQRGFKIEPLYRHAQCFETTADELMEQQS
ncbi:hypothetical protein [Pseudomonas viridiflava]|uniref:Uncharacterized protein n=1 Tax=Pseudomonas viridiflava TaxID=33069 RepID=A0A3M5P932_PSEVI|nr:hypothetical protein [Pseudomonas viridiflava]RMT80677.1 hypothetical protein ALP40_00861 [Pseudomonas viridiflava]